MANLSEAIALCTRLEPRLRRVGWHIALTGSVLYGRIGKAAARKTPSDIDVIVYPHREDGGEHDCDKLEDVLRKVGIRNAEAVECDNYGNTEYGTAAIFVFHTLAGTKVNVMQLQWKEEHEPEHV
jgi:hypothetical protein